MPLYNGSVRRSNAVGNKNSKCVVYTSPRLKALVQALPAGQPTLSGKGSIAHTAPTPVQYTLGTCTGRYHSIVGDKTVLLQDKPFQPPYRPRMGRDLFWCKGCCNWVVTARQFVPKPTYPKIGVKYYFGTVNGNAMTGEGI